MSDQHESESSQPDPPWEPDVDPTIRKPRFQWSGSALTSEELSRAADGNVINANGDKLGVVGQIYLDNQTGEPKWVTVKTDLFGTSESFVPLSSASVSGSDLVVDYAKGTIKDAPQVSADGHLTPEEERQLYAYYGLDSDSSVHTDPTDTSEEDREGILHEERPVVGKEAVSDSARRTQEALDQLISLDHPTPPAAISPATAIRVPSRHREDYVQAARTESPAETDDFPGGRLIRQRFGDGKAEITVLITDPDRGAAGDLIRLTATDGTFTALLILLPGTTTGVALHGRIEPGNDTALGELDINGPFPVRDLTADDLPTVTTSVRWADVATANAWDAAARTLNNPALDEAIDRGLEQS